MVDTILAIGDFLYCYLTPFMVGLLAAACVVAAGVFLVIILIKIDEWYADKGIRLPKLRKTVAFTEKWVKRIFYTAIAIVTAIVLGMGLWDVGLRILKRVACK